MTPHARVSIIGLVLVLSGVGILLAGEQGTQRPEGFACSTDSRPKGDSSKDPLVNERKMRELFADEKTETAKKVKFLELYGYKRYPVSNELEPFLLEKMKDKELTMPILRLFELTNRRFDADEFIYAGKPFVDACLVDKRYGDLDTYFENIRQCTPVQPQQHGAYEFRGRNPQLDTYWNTIWRQSDEYLAYYINDKRKRRDITHCSPQVVADRLNMLCEKIRPDGGGMTVPVLSLFDGPNSIYLLRCSLRKTDIPKFVELLGHRDQKITAIARRVLGEVLRLPQGTDVAKWWLENGETFSMKNHLCDILKNRRRSMEDRGNAIVQIRMQMLGGDREYNKQCMKDIASIMLDRSELEELRTRVFIELSCIVTDRRVAGDTDVDLTDMLTKGGLEMLAIPARREGFFAHVPGELVTGVLRGKIIAIALDKKESYRSRAVAMVALARGCDASKNQEQTLYVARLALNLCDEIPYPPLKNRPNGIKISQEEIRAERMDWIAGFLQIPGTEWKDSRSGKSFAMGVLQRITGHNDYGYDIEKWRKAVAELEAKAAQGVTGAK